MLRAMQLLEHVDVLRAMQLLEAAGLCFRVVPPATGAHGGNGMQKHHYGACWPLASKRHLTSPAPQRCCAVPKVLELTKALRKKAAALSKASGRQWTPQEVEQALFAAAVSGGGSSGGAAAGGSGTKRKR